MIKHIIARGIGFSPGSVKFIVTHGFGISDALGPDCYLNLFAPITDQNIALSLSFGTIKDSVILAMESGAQASNESGTLLGTQIAPSTGQYATIGSEIVGADSCMDDKNVHVKAVICDG